MAEPIVAESYKKSIDVVVAGNIITTIVYNPHSPLFERNMARLVQSLNEISKTRNIKFPEIPEGEDDSIGTIESISEPLGKFADAIDMFISAADKIGGTGVTERILGEDDGKFTLFNLAYAPIFNDYAELRGAKTGKYKA